MLSTFERRLVAVVILLAVVLLAGLVAVVVRVDHVKAWLDAPDVLAAHRTMQSLDLPEEFSADTTLTACGGADPVRCAWTDQTASDALDALVGALRDAGLEPGTVVCDSVALTEALSIGGSACSASLELPGATAWVTATDRTVAGDVALGRTAVGVVWDRTSMGAALLDRLVPELDDLVSDRPPSLAEVAAVMPARYRFAGAGDCVPNSFTVACYTTGELDVSDLGADPVPGLVAELTDAGLFVFSANTRPGAEGLMADLYYRGDDGRRRGMALIVNRVDGELRAEVYSW